MNRPDPDELLDRLQRDEEKRRRGKLKIFFGASAGVGKTYAMLQAARRRAEDGVDVVVGIVETHGRSETAALTNDLEVLPRQRIAYRGRTLEEFDLDAALERKPQLVLVDELAHSNVAGARHLKRWQDVYELLDVGIDVYTTVNVQHLESLNDVVGQITGIRVWETVPDRVFDGADEVTLVDLPAEELLDRMRDGKVYLPAQAERAVRNFFRKGNLIALRELALRRTADRVDAQMHEYRADRSIQHVWQARERLLVCVGPGPEAPALVRAAARLAASLKADWIAVYVETPRLQRLPDEIRQRTLGALKLASELGAETATLAGEDAAVTLAGYARLRNVSKLVAGASQRSGSSRWWRWLRRPFGERLAEKAEDVDLTLVRAGTADNDRLAGRDARDGSAGARAANAWRAAIADSAAHRSPPRAYAAALVICACVTVLASTLIDHIDLANLVMLYLLGVIFTATRLGRGPGVMLSFASVAAFDFFFVPPRMSFSVSDTQYLLTFVGMLLTSLVISHLTSSLRREASVAQRREQRTGAMYAMARELAAALATEQIVAIGSRHVSEVFGARVAILLPDSLDKVQQKIEDPDPQIMLDPASLDIDVGQWVYDQQKPAGHGTDTLPAAVALYLPLKAPMRTRGVLAVVTRDAREMQVPEQQRMLDAFAAQIALALERVHYVEIARDALVNMESERLRNSLLSAISHDLRTPLTTIVGFSSMLAQTHEPGTPADVQNARAGELIESIHDEALRMTGIVTNLLDMARLQAGSLKLNRQWTLLEETVGAALAACRRVLARHPVQVKLEEGLPLLQLDAVLMERLFSNLLENAAKYTPPDTPLTISARRIEEGGQPFVRVSIDDKGPGLPHGMGERVFEKFTRGEKESAKPGIGLGLAICRAIVEAHGGTIGAANRVAADGHVEGASFWFALPVEAPPPLPTDAAESADSADHADAPHSASGSHEAYDSHSAHATADPHALHDAPAVEPKPADPKSAHE